MVRDCARLAGCSSQKRIRRNEMKPTKMTLLAVLAIFALGVIPARLSAQHSRYRLVDVGTLGGPNSNPAVSLFFDGISARSLSSSGALAGTADENTPDPYPDFCFTEGCHVAHAFKWQNGLLFDLRSLAGPGDLSSSASWISPSGLISGLSQNGRTDPLLIGLPEVRAVLWKGENIINLGTLPGGNESVALAVNNRGQVVGFSGNDIRDDKSLVGLTTQTRAFLWQRGRMQDLGTLPGGSDAAALLINERGQVVGQSYTDESVPPSPLCDTELPLTLHGFIWERGALTDLRTLGGSCTFTYGLNNRGQVVGQSSVSGDLTSHPYIWDYQNGMADLGTLGGDDGYGFASWINDAGTVVGTVTNENNQAIRAVLWSDGEIRDLGSLNGDPCSAANAVNSKRQVVGGSGFFAAAFFPACTTTNEHAFLWENGRMIDLNAFVSPASDLTLTEATFINDRGEISGFAMSLTTGDQHAFVLVPCGREDDTPCQDARQDRSTTLTRPAPLTAVVPGSTAGIQHLRGRLAPGSRTRLGRLFPRPETHFSK
jgi:probable HAF family extracellular repeat protein